MSTSYAIVLIYEVAYEAKNIFSNLWRRFGDINGIHNDVPAFCTDISTNHIHYTCLVTACNLTISTLQCTIVTSGSNNLCFF